MTITITITITIPSYDITTNTTQVRRVARMKGLDHILGVDAADKRRKESEALEQEEQQDQQQEEIDEADALAAAAFEYDYMYGHDDVGVGVIVGGYTNDKPTSSSSTPKKSMSTAQRTLVNLEAVRKLAKEKGMLVSFEMRDITLYSKLYTLYSCYDISYRVVH